MEPYYADSSVTLWHGDSLVVLQQLPDASVDAVVTDPPYGLGFMGKEWDSGKSFVERKAAKSNTFDHVGGNHNPANSHDQQRTRLKENAAFGEWCEAWATECLRVLKPGGHLLAFGGSRTWHRLQCGIEDAGFEIRDSIAWLYGSGFPKSLNVAKAIASGSGRPEDIRRLAMGDNYTPSGRGRVNYDHGGASVMNGATTDVDIPPEAAAWQGWGTALKPAFEPIVVARKPLAGTVAANVLAYGAGALNIDACRIDTNGEQLQASTVPNDMRGGHYGSGHRPGEPSAQRRYTTQGATDFAATPGPRGGDRRGRWPANVILDESQAAVLDQQSGVLSSGVMRAGTRPKGDRDTYGRDAADGYETRHDTPGDTGGASRFFLRYAWDDGDWEIAQRFYYLAKADASERVRVNGVAHPTVKPLELMRWLVRLVTPPGGVVLEPFAGSGTTVEACLLEGMRCVAIEREGDYLPLIRQRIDRRRNPVAAIIRTGDDAGLFGLLNEGGVA